MGARLVRAGCLHFDKMKNSVNRLLRPLLVFLVCSGVPAAASAQLVVTSTFGPGDTYDPFSGWSISPVQSVSERFAYNGPAGYSLSQIRLALFAPASPFTVSFLTGSDMNTATVLESWSTFSTSPGIVSLSSSLTPELLTGQEYWVSVMNNSSTGWYWSVQGGQGIMYTHGNATGPWLDCPTCASEAFDVTVTAVTSTPEPATMVLMGTGLLGVFATAHRRRRWPRT